MKGKVNFILFCTFLFCSQISVAQELSPVTPTIDATIKERITLTKEPVPPIDTTIVKPCGDEMTAHVSRCEVYLRKEIRCYDFVPTDSVETKEPIEDKTEILSVRSPIEEDLIDLFRPIDAMSFVVGYKKAGLFYYSRQNKFHKLPTPTSMIRDAMISKSVGTTEWEDITLTVLTKDLKIKALNLITKETNTIDINESSANFVSIFTSPKYKKIYALTRSGKLYSYAKTTEGIEKTLAADFSDYFLINDFTISAGGALPLRPSFYNSDSMAIVNSDNTTYYEIAPPELIPTATKPYPGDLETICGGGDFNLPPPDDVIECPDGTVLTETLDGMKCRCPDGSIPSRTSAGFECPSYGDDSIPRTVDDFDDIPDEDIPVEEYPTDDIVDDSETTDKVPLELPPRPIPVDTIEQPGNECPEGQYLTTNAEGETTCEPIDTQQQIPTHQDTEPTSPEPKGTEATNPEPTPTSQDYVVKGGFAGCSLSQKTNHLTHTNGIGSLLFLTLLILLGVKRKRLTKK